MLERKTIEIDGESFSFERLSAPVGIEFFVDLFKQLGDALSGALITTGGVVSLVSVTDPESIMKMIPGGIEGLCRSLKATELLRLCRIIFAGSLVNNKPMYSPTGSGMSEFDAHFAGRYVHLFNVFAEAVKFNFGPFSGGKQ